MEATAVQPVEIRQTSEAELRITWRDGHESVYPACTLRAQCTCAFCVDEWSGRNRIAPGSIPPDVYPLDIALVGRYAIRIRWSDSHDTGIYTFERLRALCPCARCQGTAP